MKYVIDRPQTITMKDITGTGTFEESYDEKAWIQTWKKIAVYHEDQSILSLAEINQIIGNYDMGQIALPYGHKVIFYVHPLINVTDVYRTIVQNIPNNKD